MRKTKALINKVVKTRWHDYYHHLIDKELEKNQGFPLKYSSKL
jgi:hypothetical protein